MSETALSETGNETTTQATEAAPASNSLLTGQDAEPTDQAAAEGATKGDEAAAEGADAKEEGAEKAEPIEYGDFELPEGMALDEGALEAALPTFKELGLKQEQAQQLVNLYAEQQAKQMEAWQQARQGWVEAVKADKEIGGAEMSGKLTTAKTALKQFGTPELTQALDQFGMGDHPEFVRLMYRVGKAMSDDQVVISDGTRAPRDPAEVLFGATMKG